MIVSKVLAKIDSQLLIPSPNICRQALRERPSRFDERQAGERALAAKLLWHLRPRRPGSYRSRVITVEVSLGSWRTPTDYQTDNTFE